MGHPALLMCLASMAAARAAAILSTRVAVGRSSRGQMRLVHGRRLVRCGRYERMIGAVGHPFDPPFIEGSDNEWKGRARAGEAPRVRSERRANLYRARAPIATARAD